MPSAFAASLAPEPLDNAGAGDLTLLGSVIVS